MTERIEGRIASLETSVSPTFRSEDEFLRRQAADATAAMHHTIRELLDVRVHIRSHPWWAVSTACVAGIAMGRATRKKNRSPDPENKISQPARRKGLASMALTTVVSEAAKILLPSLLGGFLFGETAQLAKTGSASASQEGQNDSATEGEIGG